MCGVIGMGSHKLLKGIIHFFCCAIIVLSIVSFSALNIFGSEFPNDGFIVFNGGYRILLGQVPFYDFFIPLGPTVFYIQAFFELLFGPNIVSMIAHVAVLSSILALTFYFFLVRHFTKWVSVILSIAVYYSFIGVDGFAWYNQSALFFFMLNVLILLYFLDRKVLPDWFFGASSLFTVLAIFSKHDMGFMYFFFFTLFLLVNYSNQRRKVLLGYVVPVVVLCAGIVYFFAQSGNFFDWFNYNQPGFKSRFSVMSLAYSLQQIVFSFNLYFFIFFLALRFKEKGKPLRRLLDAGLLLNIVIGLVPLSTSALIFQTRITALPIIGVLAFLYYDMKGSSYFGAMRKRAFLKYVGLIFILVLFFNPIFSVPNPPRGEIAGVLNNVLAMRNADTVIESGCLKGYYAPGYAKKIAYLKGLFEKYDNSVLDMTYGFFYCDLGYAPKNLPVWFYEGVTYSYDKYAYFLDYIKENKPNLILLDCPDSEHRQAFYESVLSQGYEVLSSEYTQGCGSRKLGDVLLVNNERTDTAQE